MKLREVPIDSLRVTQLFLSRDKIRGVESWLRGKEQLQIPVMRVGGELFCLDGHTRLFVARRMGIETCFVFESPDSLALAGFYALFIRWCDRERVLRVSDLCRRTVSAERYRKNWELPCRLIREGFPA